MKNWNNPNTDELMEAILALQDLDEAKSFFRDLLTENELNEFANRWTAAQLLSDKVPYAAIVKQTGLSSTTVARISKWLWQGMGGYQLMLDRQKILSAPADRPVRIAIQSKGRLRQPSLDFVRSLGLEFTERDDRSLVLPCTDSGVELVFVRHCDIPGYVRRGTVDFAIMGNNLATEQELPPLVIRHLGFATCRLVVAVPEKSSIASVKDLEGLRIATSHPITLEKYLRDAGVTATVFEISGSVEVAPSLGLADAICDLTETGSTLRANGLREILTVLQSEAVLIESPAPSAQKTAFHERFVGVKE
jgi:ATP phosphoribosyltransferase